MEKLTGENIQFIDRYLKNSGVEFLDIRIEMTDHVASAVERDLEKGINPNFYSAFKAYMVRNKKNLLKNANRHRWSVDLKVLARVRKELLKTPALVMVLLFTAILSNFNVVQLEKNLFVTIPFATMILAAYFIPVILYHNLKISFLNRLSVYAYLVNYLFYLLLDHFEPAPIWLVMCYTFLVWVNYGIVISAFKLSRYYKKQFHQI